METPLRGSESVVATERDVETELTETATADLVGDRRATPNFPKTRGARALRAAISRPASCHSAWKKKNFKIFEMSLVTTAVRTVHPVRIPLQRARSANALRCRSGAPSSSRRLALEKS